MEIKQSQDLKLYIFVGGNAVSPVINGLNVNLAYTLAQAQQKLVELTHNSPPMHFTFCGSLPVQQIFEQVEGGKEIKIKSRQSFVNGLKLAAEEFLEEGKDKESLKKLLTKLEKIYV